MVIFYAQLTDRRKMEREKLIEILNFITTVECSDEQKKALLEMAANTITVDKLSELVGDKDGKKPPKGGRTENGLTFTKKEIKSMPMKYRKIFAQGDIIVPYRLRKDGVYEARLRRKDIHIEVSSKDFSVLKQKFLAALNKSEPQPEQPPQPAVQRSAVSVKFGDFVKDWLKVKQKIVKPSTFKEYDRLCNHDLLPAFGEKNLAELDRAALQNFLFSYIDAGKNRTAEKLYDLLRCIFDVAADDYKMDSPMAKVVLPKYQTKKGSALTKAEELKLVNYCRENKNSEAASAILVLLYFGLRFSELSTMKVTGNWLEIQTSKERLGQDVVKRYAPFTPMVRKNLPYIDFEKARTTKQRTIASAIKRLFPHHHPHELRYTYITRCKECGVHSEIVMMWDGHSEDRDVLASRVDRGYTDFSKEHQLKEAEKVDYEL